MHFVVELFFDRAAEVAVRAIWAELADLIPDGVPPAGARPHVSLSVYDRVDVAAFSDRLAAFAAERAAVEVEVASWGVVAVAEPVVFLAPVVTRDLLALHGDFHRRFARLGTPWPYYRPGNWVPHCTLAMGFDADLLPRIAEACHRVVRPIRGRLEGSGRRPRREIRRHHGLTGRGGTCCLPRPSQQHQHHDAAR